MDADQKLMVQFSQGDVAAFEKLYERFKGPIMSYVYGLTKNQSAAEDITQEVFLKVYRVRATYEPKAKFSTWLWTIAKHTSLDVLRKKQEILFEDRPNEEGQGQAPEIEQIEANLPDAEALLLNHAEDARLEHCLEELSPLQKDALLLRTQSDLSYDEIATLLKTSLSSVKSLIFRAKTTLVTCVKKGNGNE